MYMYVITDNFQLKEAEESISWQEWKNMNYIVHVFILQIKLNIQEYVRSFYLLGCHQWHCFHRDKHGHYQ